MKKNRIFWIISLSSLLFACARPEPQPCIAYNMNPIPKINNSALLLKQEPKLADWLVTYKLLYKNR